MTEALEPLKGFLHSLRGVVLRHRNGEISGLHVVKDPEDAEIDIVAVHGLGGEGFRSWITLDPKVGKPKSWLEELLGKDIPNARIMTYGYISDGVNYRYLVRNVLYGRALDLVQELGAQRNSDGTNRRPLFFIAHSLGGWIVKRALVISSEAADPELKDIELSTCGAAFFGTLSPGRPSSPSPLANVIRRTTSGLSDDPRAARNSGMAAAMATRQQQPHPSDMEWLENQMEAFKAVTANLPRLSFYETKKSQGDFIVARAHSMAGSDGVQIGLTSTHSDLIKFRGREDSNYKAFIGKFRDMVDKTRAAALLEAKRRVFDLAAVHRLEYLSLGFAVPYQLPGESIEVVKRQGLTDQLEGALSRPSDPSKLKLSIAHLWGPPGSGKTTLAKQYAESHKSELSFVFWVWAESWETVVASYLDFANSLVVFYARDSPRSRVENDLGFVGVEDMLKAKSVLQLDIIRVKSVVRAVKDWLLRPENDGWLLVLDNVEPSYDIFEFIPLTLSGKVILTSRDVNCCSWGSKLQVGAMTEEEAVQLLRFGLGSDSLMDGTAEAEAAKLLAHHLEFHPAKVARAAATMRKKNIGVSDYQGKFNLKLPLDVIGSTLDQSPAITAILRISAMLSSSIIPVSLFNAMSFLTDANPKHATAFSELKSIQAVDDFDRILQYLWDNNFIQTPSPTDSNPSSQSSSISSTTTIDYFLLEPSAREYVRTSLTPDEKTEHAWLACNVCVDGIRKSENNSLKLSEIHDFGRVMAPHAKACYDDWYPVLKEQSEEQDIAWHVLGNVCMTQGVIEQAIGCFELSLGQKDKMDPVERMETSLSLARLLEQDGQHRRSKEVLAGIDIESLDEVLGFRVAMARASASVAEGELGRAEDEYESLEHEQEQVLGPTDTATVNTVHRLASTLEQLGKMEEAQALFRRVYISYQNMLGVGHPMTLEALEDLAYVSMEGNAIDKAESLYKRSVEVKTKTLGAGHPSTARAIVKLAVIDDLRSRYGAAKAKYQKALNIMAPTLGRAHPLYTTTVENLALSTRWHGHVLFAANDASSASSSAAPSRPSGEHRHNTRRTLAKRSSSSINAALSLITSSSLTSGSHKPKDQNASSPSPMGEYAAGTGLDTLLQATAPVASTPAAAFREAETLYLEVVATKKEAVELYSEEQVLATGSKLREMYESEDFFEGKRGEKVAELMALLRRKSTS